MKWLRRSIWTWLVLGALSAAAVGGLQRFPPPEFKETAHPLPTTHHPEARWSGWEYVDTVVLLGALGVASLLAIRGRSRGGMLALSLFSLAYFGFFRYGCVCPIGATQNVSLAIADSSYVVPLTVLAFFLLPLVFALLFGRVFCGGVCPLGAIQDLLLIKPLRVPKWLDKSLGVVPYLYLSAAVLFAVTGTAFIICEYDPFVGFFRFDAPMGMFIFGGGLLLIGMFVGRPYCRYLCPYSVPLRHFSRFSFRHMTITPDDCIECSLCEDACPFNAIEKPTQVPEESTALARGRLVMLSVLTVGLVVGLGYLASQTSQRFAQWHPEVMRVNDWMKTVDGVIGKAERQRLHAEASDWGSFVSEVESMGQGALQGIGKEMAALEAKLSGGVDGDGGEALAGQVEALKRQKAALEQALSNLPTLPTVERAAEVTSRARLAQDELAMGGWFVGGVVGLVVGARTIRSSVYRHRRDYRADKASCLSCNRCLDSCPKERFRRGLIDEPVPLTASAAAGGSKP